MFIGERGIVMDYSRAKFGDFSFSRFGFHFYRADTQTESHTDAEDRYTHRRE